MSQRVSRKAETPSIHVAIMRHRKLPASNQTSLRADTCSHRKDPCVLNGTVKIGLDHIAKFKSTGKPSGCFEADCRDRQVGVGFGRSSKKSLSFELMASTTAVHAPITAKIRR
jgi:hypothetical protein